MTIETLDDRLEKTHRVMTESLKAASWTWEQDDPDGVGAQAWGRYMGEALRHLADGLALKARHSPVLRAEIMAQMEGVAHQIAQAGNSLQPDEVTRGVSAVETMTHESAEARAQEIRERAAKKRQERLDAQAE